jgi:hypothetical protein
LRPIFRLTAAAAAALLATACFDPPVRERLELRFLPHGAYVVSSRVEITEEGKSGNAALERRLEALRRDLVAGDDAWTQRFAALEPAVERFGWEKHLGAIHEVERSAVLSEPEQLASFFADTPLAVSYEIADGRGELAIVPGPAGRASRRQRREMESALDAWTARIADYLAAAADLYAYLDRRPERARATFGLLLADLLSETERATLGDLEPEEEDQVKRLEEAMEGAFEVLLVRPGDELSLDELSHLVYDPFPARLSVRLPAPAEDIEGFERGAEGELVVPGLGIWQALRALEGRWLSPDPVLLYVELRGRRAETPLDLGELAARERQAGPPPTADEVRLAIEERLQPASLYRAVWVVTPGEDTVPAD